MSDEKKIRCVKVTRPDCGGWCIYPIANFTDAELTDSEPGDVIHIEVMDMDKAGFDALPEFEGW